MPSLARRAVLLALLPGLAAAALTLPPAGATSAPTESGLGPTAAPAQQTRVRQVLPPGESGTWTVADEAAGRATGDYGPHTQDQRDAYWGFRYVDGRFTRSGTPQRPAPGVAIYRDAHGVPSVYGDTGRDVWFGAGYAAAQDRLFELDAIRRIATGRLAEIVGPSAVPDDVEIRTLTYTPAEYDAMLHRLPVASQQAIEGYVDGANAWIATVRSDPTKLPAEYAVLSTQPQPLTVDDVLAMGVYITRDVASQGGGEMDNVTALRELVQRYGWERGRHAFDDLFWRSDAKAVTTVPARDGRFSNDDTPPALRAGVTAAVERWALRLPAGLAHGPGTGAYPVPAGPDAAGPPPQVAAGVARAVRTLQAWAESLHGGSYQLAVAGSRTSDHRALLESAPQLGWTAPSELYLLEVHGGGYDARGATVPGLPVVGIGYGKRVAWALTTGYSKTIDSFVETTRPNPAGSGPRQYLHDGRWVDERCHDETVSYRPATQGVPFGPAVEQVVVPVCRTVHGPVVATSGRYARSEQFAMWEHEVDTINGVLQWDRAQNLREFAAGVRKVSWNENVMYADADGHIAYWHPGRYPRRSPYVDQRFPTPGTGPDDWRGLRPFRAMPHVVDPRRGWLANWNNLPAAGWTTGDAEGYSGGAFDHVQVVASQLRHAHALSFDDLVRIDRHVGNSDARSIAYLPLLRRLAAHPPRAATGPERAALRLLAGWDGQAADPTAGVDSGGRDPAAATLFDAYVGALRQRLFSAALPADLVRRASAVALHRYDVTTLDNLALRVLEPATSALRAHLDYLRGRSPAAVQLAALRDAMAAMRKQFGTTDLQAWRRPHPTSAVDSLTGVVGPSFTEPYEDRGTYIQLVGFAG